jgi:hypothetical protein
MKVGFGSGKGKKKGKNKKDKKGTKGDDAAMADAAAPEQQRDAQQQQHGEQEEGGGQPATAKDKLRKRMALKQNLKVKVAGLKAKRCASRWESRQRAAGCLGEHRASRPPPAAPTSRAWRLAGIRPRHKLRWPSAARAPAGALHRAASLRGRFHHQGAPAGPRPPPPGRS